MIRYLSALALAAALWIGAPPPSTAQQASGNAVQQSWLSQGRISNVSVTTSSAATVLPSGGSVAWICNIGAADAYLKFGGSTVTVTVANGSWIKASTCNAYSLRPFGGTIYTYMAAIGASSTTLFVETGTGTPQSAELSFNGTIGSVTQGTTPWVTQDSPAGYSYTHIPTATTTLVKSGAGVLHTICVNALGTVASTVKVDDALTDTTPVVAVINSLSFLGCMTYDVSFATGLTIVTTGTVAPDVTVSWR